MFDELPHLLTDPNHWAFEIIVNLVLDGLVLGLGLRLFKGWLAKHDEMLHGITRKDK